MNQTTISWTKVTWNPVHGCSRVSEGCRNCYAERISRQKKLTTRPWTARNAVQNVQLKPHKLRAPFKLKTPERIFVNSMSDLFHPQVPDDYIAQVWEVMVATPQHTYQILTKRPERAVTWPGPWLPHIWMGTSVEDRASLHRIDTLRACGAQVRFLSCEPLLEPLGSLNLTGYHWVIVGGESGPAHRPMAHQWAAAIKDGCVAAGIAFFFKQSAASRAEMGTSLQDTDGAFWIWQLFPGQLLPPTRGAAHGYMYANVA